MTDIQKRIDTLKKALKGELPREIADAIRREIGRLERRQNGVGKQRLIEAADGVLVGAGSFVYRYKMPHMAFQGSNKPDKECPPEIEQREIQGVTPAGKADLGGSGSVLLRGKWYSTPEAAYKEMLAEAQMDAKHATEKATETKHFLAVVKAFKPKVSRKVTSRKKRAS